MEKDIKWVKIPQPEHDAAVPVMLTDETIEERKRKLLLKMEERGLDRLIIYGDVEHGYNFMYLTGFFTRFEESLMIVTRDGSFKLVLGNENLNKAGKSRVKAESIHAPQFSLPNQPDICRKTVKELLQEAGIGDGQKIGIAGWKYFTGKGSEKRNYFDVPSYIVDAVRELAGNPQDVTNETDIFIGENGIRTTNNANEIAHYEYGASLASDCMLDAMDLIEEGVSEMKLGDALVRDGQPTNIVTIAATGERFIKGNMFPTKRCIRKGDQVSLTVGYYGGSSSRAGVAAKSPADLPVEMNGYLEKVAIPYFRAYTAWLENIRIGMSGGDMFRIIDSVLPRNEYGWTLCPGHLTAEEEWLCSPIYENSEEELKSGMIFQIDILPSVPGLPSSNAESTVVLAGRELRKEIEEQYPEMYERMKKRREYLRNKLGIRISEDILPMCSSVAYMRPCLLSHEYALVKYG